MKPIYNDNLNKNRNETFFLFYKTLLDNEFQSFSEIELFSKEVYYHNTDSQDLYVESKSLLEYIKETLENDNDIELSKKLLIIFPFYFFIKNKDDEQKQIVEIIKANKKRFKRREQVIELFKFSFDVKILHEGLNNLKNEGYIFNYPYIVTQIYRILLEYAFLTLSNTIKFGDKDTVLDLVDDFSKTSIKTNLKKQYRLFLDFFYNNIADESEKPEEYIKHKDLFLKDKYLLKILFSAIYFNIKKDQSALSNKDRNKILNKIFHHLITNIFKDLRLAEKDDIDIIRKLKNTIVYLDK